MKNKIMTTVGRLFVLGSLLAVSAQAADHSASRHNLNNESPITTTRSAPSEFNGNGTFGLGFATFNNPVSGFSATSTAASAWLELGGPSSLQILFSINSTSPAFTFGAGAAYRYTLAGNHAEGFHIGAGAVLGTAQGGFGDTVFGANIYGLMGFHFHIPGVSHVMVSFDGGPAVHIASGNTQFTVAALSPLLGLSVHYMF